VSELAKPLPANIDAERTLLGVCLQGQEAAAQVLSSVDADDFSLPHHKTIFREIQLLQAQQIPIELHLLVESLTTSQKLEPAGGAPYVASLTDGIPQKFNVAHHTGLVRRKAKLRRLIHLADSIQREAFEASDLDTDALIDRGISQLLGLADGRGGPAIARKWNEVAASAVAEYENAFHNPDLSKRINFGLSDLDEALGGLRRKDLVEIVAPTSNGKTLLAAQCAFQADRDGFKVMFFSAEMPSEQVAMREVAYQAGVPFYVARRPERATLSDVEKLKKAARTHYNVDFIDRDITPARIWAMAEAAKRIRGLDLVIVDYDQLVIEAGMNPDSDDDNIFRHQRAFVSEAKKLAQRLDICFLFLSQLRKLSPAVLKGTAQPHLDDIWGDSAVRNTPQVILWLSRDFFTNGMKEQFERAAKVYVLKNRGGQTGVVDLEFDPQRVRFLDAPPTEADSIPEAQWQ